MRRSALPLALLLLALLGAGCASSRARGHRVERGIASWYGPGFHGRPTASGERYDMDALTAAHNSLPLGTVVLVTNLVNERTVRVRINDRGPFEKNRILDLSRAAAELLDMIGPGTALVEIAVLGYEPIGGYAFAVQVGAFQEPELASKLAESLRAIYPEVEVRTVSAWSRVQVGKFARREAAEALASELRRAGYAVLVVPLQRK